MTYEDPLGSIRLMKGKANYKPSLFNLARVPLLQKYNTPRCLKAFKLKHMRDLSVFVPMHYMPYYTKLFREQEAIGADTDIPEMSDFSEDIENDLLDVIARIVEPFELTSKL
ncbi:hypothetical protein GWK47_033397 [Chionoecetes opilio]|uniref:Uncharacterized protein n=1 Tax=Chionoecetes opilio TaxID=41210 RepID=A0A8J5D3D7_CHIOP|nr:hypothetical protein GWK47_033397 [Chionoecetes opilio]